MRRHARAARACPTSFSSRSDIKSSSKNTKARAPANPHTGKNGCEVGPRKKKNLRDRLNRYRAEPDSAAYRRCYKDAEDAGIRLGTVGWHFPAPVPRAAQPAPP